ncbi:microtubule-associated protein 9 [Sphaeramia orbicularis]|uniref:microtubule-associated protein 9 n=1 Tax=Sphaeramia orbicularis TaxID=375764 RepID=UPI00117D8696|nr:microtubule-associated protein 9 [Sphaeramia orbicularis]
MTNRDFRTLAYTKSPKTSKRTTFQDELEAAVSARASKTKAGQYSYSDDFNEDEDDFLNDLLKSRKKRVDTYKTGRSKAKVNNFDLSEDEGTPARTKRVSFLKTQRNSSPLEDTTASEHNENEPPDSSIGGCSNYSSSFSTQPSTNVNEDDLPHKQSDDESTNPQIIRESSSKSLSYQTSEDMPLPLQSESSILETPDPVVSDRNEERNQTPELSAGDLKPAESSADSVAEKGPPRPKPRQKTLGLSLHTTEKQAESQDLSRPQTSSTAIPLSSDALDEDTTTSCSPPCIEGEHVALSSLSKSSSGKSEQSQLLTKSTFGSESRDGFVSDDSKEHEGKHSTSLQDFNEVSGDHLNFSDAQLSQTSNKSHEIQTSRSHCKTSQRPRSACTRKVESKYLGSLKILDISLQDSQPQEPNSMRAAVYQEWLRKKKEKSRENMQLKKKEEIIKENKKREQNAKKEDAVASYEAWKEKKAECLKAKAKEKQDKIRKEQRAIEEKEEKKQSAKQVFEKWKHEHDLLLKEKYRKEREAENKRNLQKQEEEEERKRGSTSAFSDWCKKKKDVLHNKATMQRKELKTKAEEEEYMREERDKMALEMYESWLTRKDLEKKRQKEERYIQAILRDSPPPPWSPPNKTIPQGK